MKKNNNNILYSFLIAFFISILVYFTNNWALFTGERSLLYTLINTEDQTDCNAFFVNTSKDKQLIDVYENDILVGSTAITDRRKLLNFLQLLEQIPDAYEYVVIDICFAEELADRTNPQVDTELFDKIKSMDRCVVATMNSMKLLGGLESKAALAEYKSTVISTNFVRYQYFDMIPSIPLHIYNKIRKEQKKDTINYRHASYLRGLYTEGSHLCQNSLFLTFSSNNFTKSTKIITESGGSLLTRKDWYKDLGQDYIAHLDNGEDSKEVLEMLEAEIKETGKGLKPVVFIGNIQEDLHDTYAGTQPGVIILYKALHALQEGKHLVNPIMLIVSFLLYFIMSLLIITDINISDFLPIKIKQKLSLWLVLRQLIPMTIVFSIMNIIYIKFFGITTNFMIPIILLGAIKLHIKFKKYQYYEKKC